jgi:hypothetical protein
MIETEISRPMKMLQSSESHPIVLHIKTHLQNSLASAAQC